MLAFFDVLFQLNSNGIHRLRHVTLHVKYNERSLKKKKSIVILIFIIIIDVQEHSTEVLSLCLMPSQHLKCCLIRVHCPMVGSKGLYEVLGFWYVLRKWVGVSSFECKRPIVVQHVRFILPYCTSRTMTRTARLYTYTALTIRRVVDGGRKYSVFAKGCKTLRPSTAKGWVERRR